MIDYRYFGIHFKEGKEKLVTQIRAVFESYEKEENPKKNTEIKPDFKI